MSKELDKKRCGANVEKVIIDEFVPSKAIDNSNPSEALEFIKMLLDVSGSEKHFINLAYWDTRLNLIKTKQALLKAQEQKEMIVELCEYFGLDDLYPYDDLEKIESALKNARDVSTQQRMELLGKLNKQEKEDAELKSRIQDLEKDLEEQQELAKHYLEEQEKVLEIIKKKHINVNRFIDMCIFEEGNELRKYNEGLYLYDKLTQEEFDLLKRWIEK